MKKRMIVGLLAALMVISNFAFAADEDWPVPTITIQSVVEKTTNY